MTYLPRSKQGLQALDNAALFDLPRTPEKSKTKLMLYELEDLSFCIQHVLGKIGNCVKKCMTL